MSSKKSARSKRAVPPRACDYTKTFFKDWERLSHSGRYDLNRLKEAMLLLICNEAPLGPEWIYRLEGASIIFVRAGTHSELFEE